MNENRCVCCGEIIPEGRQVCLHCEKGETEKIQEMARIMLERSPCAKRPIYDIKGKSVSLGENSTKFLDNILEEIFIPYLATELYEAGYRKESEVIAAIKEDAYFQVLLLEQEIERLKSILNNYALQYGTVTDMQKVIELAEQEVAREIFEEIEGILNEIGYFDEIDLTELKKKYIGE